MSQRRALLALTILLPGLVAGCLDAGDPAGSPSPYVDQTRTEIRGLSAEEIDELRTGAGMGLARPAELNGYPGPLHVLELAEELGLSADQRDAVQALRAGVVADASALGARILERHARLEERFRGEEISLETLQAELDVLEGMYSELRFIHLRAHLDTFPLLSEEQRLRYDHLRGYTSPEPEHGGDHAGHAGH